MINDLLGSLFKKFNMNFAFILFSLVGLLGALFVKIIFSDFDNSFYPTLSFFVILLVVFHRLSYFAIIHGKFKDIGNEKRLTDSSIVDSVYYLGFTFTLLILVTSFVSVGEDPGTAKLKYDSQLMGLLDILNRFCVGLFTTGYGLVARIHLSNLIEIEELDPEGLKEKLNVKTAALINVIEFGASSLVNLIDTSNKSVVSSVSEATNSLNQQSLHLTQNLTEISNQLGKISTKLKRQVENLDLSDATGAVEIHLSNTAKGVEILNNNIDNISKNFSGAGSSINESSQTLISVINKINDQNAIFLSGLNNLSASLNITASNSSLAGDSFKQSSDNLLQLKDDVLVVDSQFSKLTENLNLTLNSLNNFSNSYIKNQEILKDGSDLLNNSMLNSANAINKNINELSIKISEINLILSNLKNNISSNI
jgi:methyl-accepting chemotaxis protein